MAVSVFSQCICIILQTHLVLCYHNYIQYGKTFKMSNDLKAHSVVRRSAIPSEKNILSHESILLVDRDFDMQHVWTGTNSETQLILATMKIGFLSFLLRNKIPSQLFRSNNGGLTFDNIKSEIGNTEIRSEMGIMQSPLNKNKVIFISYTSNDLFFHAFFMSLHNKPKTSTFVITTNGAKTFTQHNLPFKIREGTPLYFHPKKEDWIIALESRGGAWISKDFGVTWKSMMSTKRAVSVKWGAEEGREGEKIYLATQNEHPFFSLLQIFTFSASLTLWKSNDGGEFFEEIVEHCFSFGVQDNFIFASVNMTTKENDGDVDEKRILHVSKDSGETFHRAKLPQVKSDMFYAVLAVHKGMVFLHVDDEGNTGKGTLYISDADGITYTKSLTNHFYPNEGITDFTQVTSMEGVYITQRMIEHETLQTMISFDQGVAWQPLYIDKKKYCNGTTEVCTLNLHISYSIKAKHVLAYPPLFSENAPGIILAHGQASDALTGEANVWLSRNGGYNWTQVGKGVHRYAIGDSGNLIVIYPKYQLNSTTLRYSIDQGHNWGEYQFAQESEPINVHGLVTEPRSKERRFTLWGHVQALYGNDTVVHVFTIDFNHLFTKKCGDADYEEWYPHLLNGKGGCILGQRTTFKRPKVDVTCYLGEDYDAVVKRVKCNCTKDDLECDYGYERQDDGSCKRLRDVPLEEVCQHGHEMQKSYSKGYRRFPGDVCNPLHSDHDVVKYIDEKKQCMKLSAEDYYGVYKMEVREKEREEEIEKDEKRRKETAGTKTTKTVPLLLAIACLIILCLFGIWYYKKRYRPTVVRAQAFSSMTEFDDEAGNETNQYDHRPKELRPFSDETEDDEAMLLPV